MSCLGLHLFQTISIVVKNSRIDSRGKRNNKNIYPNNVKLENTPSKGLVFTNGTIFCTTMEVLEFISH